MHWNNGCRITVGKTSRVHNPDTITQEEPLHEEIEIKYFYDGTATLLIESQTVNVKAGDIVVINPYEFHATANTGKNQGKYHLYMIPLDYFSGIPELDLDKQFVLENKRFQTHYSGDSEMCTFLERAAQEALQQQPGCEVMIKGLLIGFFALLGRKGIIETENTCSQKKMLRLYSVIKPALHCIKNEYHRTLSVDEMAELCKVSKHYFCRSFKAVTGKGPMEYLRDFRLRMANALLSGTTKSIAEISELCGFDYPNYFSRCYKKYYGIPPSHNRKSNL